MAKRITLQALGEDDELTHLVCYDTVCASVLLRILLGGEDELTISIGRICEAIGIKSKSVVKRRLDWLSEAGVINKTLGETKWDATTYEINYDSRLFVKKRTVKKGLMEIDNPEEPFETTPNSSSLYKGMVELFVDKNFEVHGKRWVPRSPKAREDWELACKKILEFEGVTPELYADVVDFLANQYKGYLEGEQYCMQVQSIPNMLYVQPNKSITKLESALDKMQAKRNYKPGQPTNTNSNIELLKKRARQDNKGDDNAETRSSRLLRHSSS
tara:strand:- start:2219 stop:3034 length:816 start_codon:yes stop_codon:yes gene_type:complete